MNKISKALLLADEVDNDKWTADTQRWAREAADELRRLHKEVDSLSYRLAYPQNFECESCKELVETLQKMLTMPCSDGTQKTAIARINAKKAARKAIASATGEHNGNVQTDGNPPDR